MPQLPAYLTTSQGPRLAERTVQHLGASAPPYVSIEGNRFTLIDAVGAEEPITTVDPQTGMFYLDAVVLDALEIESKIYYAKPYEGKSAASKPPDCWSDNGIAPSRNVAPAPELGVGPTCAACPKAVWGSKIGQSGKGVPACGKYQKLALMIPGDDVMFLLRVPPNSLSNLRDYLHRFRGQNFDVKDVTTRISFVKDQLGTLVFHATAMIDEPTYRQREAAYVAKATDQLVGRGDLPREGLPAPAAVRQISHSPENRQEMTPPVAFQAPPPPNQPAQPAPAEPARQPRKRRTAAEMAAANQAAAAPGPQVAQQAPFRPAPSPIQPNGPRAQNPGNFGIQQGVEPNAEIQNTLDSIFK